MARKFVWDSSAAAERAACRNGPKRKGSETTRLKIFRAPGRTFPSLRALLALHTCSYARVAAQPRCVRIFRVWHWIKSTLGEGTATPQPFQSQPTSAPRAVQFDRFLRVIRTRRIKLAGSAQKRRKENLVKLHQGEQPPRANRLGFHCGGHSRARIPRRYCGAFAPAGISFNSSACNAANCVVAAELRG